MRLTAAQYQGPFSATPALRALVRVPGRRIVTTNYDEAIEHAARYMGLEPRSFTPATLNEFLLSRSPKVLSMCCICTGGRESRLGSFWTRPATGGFGTMSGSGQGYEHSR